MILLFSAFADNFIYTGLEVSMMIGQRLQEIRKDNGDTQQDLANKLHASLYAVRCWEQGKSDPSHDTLAAICRLYDVSADYLLGLSDEDPRCAQRRQSRLTPENAAMLKRFEAFLLYEQAHGKH